MKKKVLAMMLGAMMCFSMVGCGSDDATTTTNEADSVEAGVEDESTTTGIDSGDVDAKGQESDTVETDTESSLNEVTSNDNEKVSSDTITIDICGVKFNLGDEWEPIREQLEAKDFDFTMQENLGAYHFDEDNEASFYYRTGEIDGKNVIKLIRYSLPEPYIIDKDFQENMVKFNGYTVTETEEFAIAHNLGENYKAQNIETDNNIILIDGKSITISTKE